MLDAWVTPTLPPAVAVGELSPAAAEKIRAVTEYESRPPKRGSGEEPSVDELRAEAFAEFNEEFYKNLAAEDAALLETLTADVARMRAHWDRLEQIRGLQHWAAHGQRLYGPKPVAVLQVSSGFGGNKTPITARQIFQSFDEVLGRGGR